MSTKTRVVVSIAVLAAAIVFLNLYSAAQGPVEGAAAVAQVNGGNAAYVAGREIASGLVPKLVKFGTAALFALLWLPVLFRRLRPNATGNTAALGLLVLLGSVATTGCMGPAKIEKFEEIGPNETAYLIPLEGDSARQAKFASVDYLEAHKVAAKRIDIPQREKSTGRAWWDYEWIGTVRVIKVNRASVTRQWSGNNSLCMESKDSINFCVGLSATMFIEEPNTSRFLYFYSGVPLETVMDNNVRGFAQKVIAREFAGLPLIEVVANKQRVAQLAEEETRSFFASKGITLEYLGLATGIEFPEPKIQEAMNAKFVAENDKKVALEQEEATKTRNRIKVSQAEASAREAALLSSNADAYRLKTSLDIEKTKADALLKFADKWNGQMPEKIIPQGTAMMMGLDVRGESAVPAKKQ